MKFRILYLLTAFLSLSCACNEADNGEQTGGADKVTVTPESISVSNMAADLVLTVNAECDWGIYADDKTWISVSPSGGIAGKTDVAVSIAENKTGEVRETSLTVRYGSSKLSVPVRQNYEVHEVEISDPGFKAALLDAYDVDKDGILSTNEASVITKIEASGRGIKDLSGLAVLFPGLTYLDCSDNQLSYLDISELAYLEYLDATGNPSLKEIRVWSAFEGGDNFKKPESAQWVYPDIPTPAGYKLVWCDEFNNSDTGMPNLADWWYETAGPGWVNNEKQTYVAGRRGDIITAEVSGGTLKIHLVEDKKEYLSARVNTKQGWTYGYFEARLKLPKGLGTWPAFWMMPTEGGGNWPACGEIDIMEHVGADLNQVSSSIHCMAYYHKINTQKTKARYLAGATDEFHVYALEWTPDYIRSFVDGEQLFYYNPDDYPKGRNADTWPFDKPFQLKLNLAWGGDWGGYKGMDYDCLPQTYEIDYVRVFQKP